MERDEAFARWMRELEKRHLADLRMQELTRALRALSSVYVERRDALARGAALDSNGKRAAFALFYGPLHFLVAQAAVRALGASAAGPRAVVDLGCGTGAVGSAWALDFESPPRVLAFDRHPWAIGEAAWTYRTLGLDASVRRDDVRKVRLQEKMAVALGFTANELPDDVRQLLLQRLCASVAGGSRALVVEPIARPAGTWWDQWAEAFRAAGGREDTWRFETELPEILRTLDRAAGLDHRTLTARTLYVAGS